MASLTSIGESKHELSNTLQLPDPFATASLPTAGRKIPTTEKNAYLQFSQRGNKPADIPQNTAIPWTQAMYPHPVITCDDLLDSLDPQQRAKVEANPGNFLAVVPICARKVFYQKNPSIHHDVLKFILSLGFTYDGINDVCNNLQKS
ncbi:hypothetical protein B0H14DRAFT_3514384 [Mycena olivaceomarginata]|nr:hypothetical protein B0H14DRAFT_3514384 [Mycena olivaceomarginata]